MTDAFHLIESILWEPTAGYFLLPEHLDRVTTSAAHFGIPSDRETLTSQLLAHARALTHPTKVRLLVHRSGEMAIENAEVRSSAPLRLVIDQVPIDGDDPFLRHKTSHRQVYAQARARNPQADDVILHNQRGELTETTFCNLVLALDGRLMTPHRDAGLLPGTFRRHLLERGTIQEVRLTLADLGKAQAIWGVNAVRRWCPATLFDRTEGQGPTPAEPEPAPHHQGNRSPQ